MTAPPASARDAQNPPPDPLVMPARHRTSGHAAAPTIVAGPGNWSFDRTLGGWSYYFVLKLLLYWRGLIDFHAPENLAFLALLSLPLSRRWHAVRLFVAVPAAFALLYHDSFLPPVSRLLSQAGAMANFSLPYLIALGGRFFSGPIVALLAGALLALVLARRFIRLGVLVLAVLVSMSLARLPALMSNVPQALQAATPGGAGIPTSASLQSLAASGKNADLNRLLSFFYTSESRRAISLPVPDAAALPFDLLFIHVCSLSWDDLEAVGLQEHPFWKSFDIVFRRFNAAASYSGPAAVRLNRATCGQSSNDGLYAPASKQCYLMPSLKQAGFDINFAMNHDGHFDDFLPLVRLQGVQATPISLDKVPVTMKGFDDSPIYSDAAVLSRWRTLRTASNAPRTALYYNTITLHDGNRLTGPGAVGLSERQSYKVRLTRLLDELEELTRSLSSGSRRTVLVLVPEHGAALRGDRLQIAGLREIPTAAITTVPVGIKIIDPAVTVEHSTEYVDAPSSFLALSELIGRMLEKSPFGPLPFDPKPYVARLPVTQFVSENKSVVMRVQERYFWREDKDRWQALSTEPAR